MGFVKSKQSLLSFNAGEISPRLYDRVDLDKYRFACQTLNNGLVSIYGDIERRPGLEYIAEVKDSIKRTRLIRFQFSTTVAYVLEFGDQYIRFYNDGSQILSSGSPYEIASPYLEADLFEIQFAQINDVMYLTHPSREPRRLVRIADTNWELQQMDMNVPPLLDENTTATTITPSGTNGSITLTASSSIFTSGHVGSFWQISHTRDASFVERSINSNGVSDTISIQGGWSLETQGIWEADILLERSLDGGTIWETVRGFTGNQDRQISANGTQDLTALFRVRVANYVTGNSIRTVYLEADDSVVNGIVKITGYTNGTTVTATTLTDLHQATATTAWAEGAWSEHRGFPTTVTFFENRIWYASTDHEPQKFWGSRTGDYQNFEITDTDTGAVSRTISSNERNPILWFVSSRNLILGTPGGEWVVSGSVDSETVTNTNITVRRHSNVGSKQIQALLVENAILFVQRLGKKVIELQYNFSQDSYAPKDLNALAPHITGEGIRQISYQQQPTSRVWITTTDGKLCALTYDQKQDVFGWQNFTSFGEFDSVESIYGASNDEIWVVVKRTINSVDKRFIERLFPTVWEDKEDAFFVDSGISYDGSATTTITGLDHLNGEAVAVLADGYVVSGKTVSSNQITLDVAASKVHVGLPYTTEIKPLRLDIDPVAGITQGLKKRIRELFIRLDKTLGLTYTIDGVDTQYPFRATNDLMDASPPLFTGYKRIEVDGNNTYDCEFSIKQTDPLPMTIRSIVVKYEIMS